MRFDLSEAGIPGLPQRGTLGPEPGLDEAPLFSGDAGARTALGFAAYADERHDRQREAAKRAVGCLAALERSLFESFRDVRSVKNALLDAWGKELEE